MKLPEFSLWEKGEHAWPFAIIVLHLSCKRRGGAFSCCTFDQCRIETSNRHFCYELPLQSPEADDHVGLDVNILSSDSQIVSDENLLYFEHLGRIHPTFTELTLTVTCLDYAPHNLLRTRNGVRYNFRRRWRKLPQIVEISKQLEGSWQL